MKGKVDSQKCSSSNHSALLAAEPFFLSFAELTFVGFFFASKLYWF